MTRALLAALAVLVANAAAAEAPARISIIIDDLGYRPTDARRAASLPGPVACAVLPGTPYAADVARACHEAGKDVLLHLPMQSIDAGADPGEGALLLSQDRAELERRLAAALARVPHAVGVNNHMGSALTPRVAPMHWLMRGLAARGLWFVDSYTTAASVAADSARLAGVPVLRRDVFLDNERDAGAIEAEWARLLAIAGRAGHAVAIGHPHEETFTALEAALPGLGAGGFSLVSPTDMMSAPGPGEGAWHEYSSR